MKKLCYSLIPLFLFLFHLLSWGSESYKISWCGNENTEGIQSRYSIYKTIVERRTSLILPNKILFNSCKLGKSDIFWFDKRAFQNFDLEVLKNHIANGGIFIVEGFSDKNNKQNNLMNSLQNSSIGLQLESPSQNGMFYRSFYLLKTIDGCLPDHPLVLMWKKKTNAQAPVGLFIQSNFFSSEKDCFGNNDDFKIRSFINIIFSFLTTDYKEDQSHLPEILKRIQNLGLEP